MSRGDTSMVKAVGVIMVLFGAYRIFSFYTASNRYQRLKDDDNDE
jgi:hypothetical protein